VPVEIERKFLVASDDWRESVTRREHLIDGLIASSNGRKVRVRIREDEATLTIKSERIANRRYEYEYPIPLSDAKELLAMHCGTDLLDKIRHYVKVGSHQWIIDCYMGALDGVIIAEVELTDELERFTLPDWIGREVTADPAFRKINLLRSHRGAIDR
jgi:CYTH domain-containing protein